MLRHIVLAFCLLFFPTVAAHATAPDERCPEDIMTAFLGIPYRPDGMVNDRGEFALFNAPETPLPTPGLNCSGLVLEASRLLTRRNITTADAVRDRLNDSGPASPLGQDWDFGFDLIMNIAEATDGTLILPQGAPPGEISGRNAAAWNPHGENFAAELFPLLRPGFFYLLSFSRHITPEAPARQHYHVGLLLPDASGALWLYSTTSASKKAIRLNLADPAQLARFRHSFRNTEKSRKRLTAVAIPLNDAFSRP